MFALHTKKIRSVVPEKRIVKSTTFVIESIRNVWNLSKSPTRSSSLRTDGSSCRHFRDQGKLSEAHNDGNLALDRCDGDCLLLEFFAGFDRSRWFWQSWICVFRLIKVYCRCFPQLPRERMYDVTTISRSFLVPKQKNSINLNSEHRRACFVIFCVTSTAVSKQSSTFGFKRTPLGMSRAASSNKKNQNNRLRAS